MKIPDKVFIVTGGGNGIGREVVLQLLSKKAKVAVIDLNETALDELTTLAGENKNNFSKHLLNITDREKVKEVVDGIVQKYGVIDGLINCAGIIQPFINVSEIDYKTVHKVFDVNFFGTLYLVKETLPFFKLRPEAYIVNISSMGGFFPVSCQSIYGASKAAIKILTEGLYFELLDTKIHVTLVIPGGVSSNIVNNSGVEMSSNMKKAQSKIKILTPIRAAKKIVKGIEHNSYRIFLGIDSNIMNILYKISPKNSVKLVGKILSKIVH